MLHDGHVVVVMYALDAAAGDDVSLLLGLSCNHTPLDVLPRANVVVAAAAVVVVV